MNADVISVQTPLNFLLAGVGGQGTLLASNVLAEVGMELGKDVKKAEVHGMSQRGGSVISHVRWGENVYSPMITSGEVDVLLVFEKIESLRVIEKLRPGGLVLVNDYSIFPVSVSSGSSIYPDDDMIKNTLHQVTDRIIWVNCVTIAETLGNLKVSNVVLLGALSILTDTDRNTWLSVLEKQVPERLLDINLRAFNNGREIIN